jgi:hypothetical protein
MELATTSIDSYEHALAWPGHGIRLASPTNQRATLNMTAGFTSLNAVNHNHEDYLWDLSFLVMLIHGYHCKSNMEDLPASPWL